MIGLCCVEVVCPAMGIGQRSQLFPCGRHTCCCCFVAFLLAVLPVLKCSRRRAEVAVAIRSSGGRGARGPDCELTVILVLPGDGVLVGRDDDGEGE